MTQCDTGAQGSPPFATRGNWVGYLPGNEVSNQQEYDSWDNPMEFALFGLARQLQFPKWTKVDWTKQVLDLGPGNKLIEGAIRCEYPQYNFESPENNPHATIQHVREDSDNTGIHYFDKASEYRSFLPFDDNSIGGIYAVNILEHLWDPRPIMEECARVLAPGSPLNIVVPHGSYGIYLQDLDHKKPFIIDSFKNWLQNGYWGPDRSNLNLDIGAVFKFGVKEENVNIMAQLIKKPVAEVQEIKNSSGEVVTRVQ